MHPLTAIELGDDFSLSKSIKYGHLPKAYTSDNPAEFLSSYVQTYIKEEVAEEGLTRQIGNFYRFLETASFSQGEVLNISEIAREAMLKRSLVENYFSILEDLLLAIRVPVFNKRAKRVLLKHDKFYFFDVGVFREIRPAGPLDSESEIDGPALETLVLQELSAVNQYKRLGYKIYYWRTKTGLEVDFVLYGKRGLLAIEVKRKSTVTKKDLRGLRAFKKDYPEATTLVLYGGREKIYYDNIPALPFDCFFRNSIDVLIGKF
jgi:predicted AAA+ superfamily ATPase